ncbi:MAG: hypothetical protein LIO77_10715 [Rikenellaceae bacterium]|nr:hypothetical protein [Rikenellaceae bacterium]
MILLLLIISASVVGIASILKKRKRKNRDCAGDFIEIPPAAVLTVDLEDCIVSSLKQYHEPPENYNDRFESLRSNFDPASKKIEQDVTVLKYQTEYKGEKKPSEAIPYRSTGPL